MWDLLHVGIIAQMYGCGNGGAVRVGQGRVRYGPVTGVAPRAQIRRAQMTASGDVGVGQALRCAIGLLQIGDRFREIVLAEHRSASAGGDVACEAMPMHRSTGDSTPVVVCLERVRTCTRACREGRSR